MNIFYPQYFSAGMTKFSGKKVNTGFSSGAGTVAGKVTIDINSTNVSD